MCVCWQKLCLASHVLFSISYIVVGAIQLIAGIFFFISLPVFKIGSNIWTGIWNVIAGVGGAVFSCVGDLNPNKQQVLLYLTLSVLVINVFNLAILELGEWRLMLPDNIKEILYKENLKTLVVYARMMTSISTGVAVLASFIDTQFMFCWLEHNLKQRNRHDHNETVSDIDYIIPRVKSSSVGEKDEVKKKTKTAENIYNHYAQSWVFETETVGSSRSSDSPYSKLQQFNGSKTVILKRKTKRPDLEQLTNTLSTTASLKSKSQPMVLVEDTTIDNERQLQFMTSFSRTPSPVGQNTDSSNSNNNSSPASPPSNPMIYKCLEKLTEPSVYKSHLNTALVMNIDQPASSPWVSPRPKSIVVNDQVQYASLMVELEKTIGAKFPPNATPNNLSQTVTRSNSRRASSRTETSTFHAFNHPNVENDNQLSTFNPNQTNLNQSETDFSKALEAALKLIQDLDSPNTSDILSDNPSTTPVHLDDNTPSRPRCLISQMTEGSTGSPVVRSPVISGNSDGKVINDQNTFCYLHHAYCDNCYYMKSQENLLKQNYYKNIYFETPLSSSSNENKSINLIQKSKVNVDDLSVTLNKNKLVKDQSKIFLRKKLNLSDLVEDNGFSKCNNSDINTNINNDSLNNSSVVSLNNMSDTQINDLTGQTVKPDIDSQASTSSTNVLARMKSALKLKPTQPLFKDNKKLVLMPELEDSILKSESLVHLSDNELLQRYKQNKNVQRTIEERVFHRINGFTNSDTYC